MSALLDSHVFVALKNGWSQLRTAGSATWLSVWEGVPIEDKILLAWWSKLEDLNIEKGYPPGNEVRPPAVYVVLAAETPNDATPLGWDVGPAHKGMTTDEVVDLVIVAQDSDLVTAIHYAMNALMLDAAEWFTGSCNYADMSYRGGGDVHPLERILPHKAYERKVSWAFTASSGFPRLNFTPPASAYISAHGTDYEDAVGNPGEIEGHAPGE